MQSWSWSSSSGSCQGATSQKKTVQTTTVNGQRVVTTTYTNNPGQTNCPMTVPQTISYEEPKNVPQTNKPISNGGTQSSNPFEQECLDEHNRLRALHGCPPLKLSSKLSAYATEWAKHLAARNTMQHRSQRTYGENLFMASGCNVTGKMAVKSWYDEIAQYSYSRPGFSSGTGHFTQVVWKNSKEVGVGVAKRGSTTYVVANYDPAGNFGNEYQQNVPRRLG